MLLWVGGLLALVLWRRQNLRARAQRLQQQQQWTSQNGAAVAAAAAEPPPPPPAGVVLGGQPQEGQAARVAAGLAAAEARAAVVEPEEIPVERVLPTQPREEEGVSEPIGGTARTTQPGSATNNSGENEQQIEASE